MREKVSITNKTSDKTTRQSVSNPSSPTLVRAGRLRSASTGNIADTMENRNIQSATPLIGEIPEQEQQRNLLNNRFGVSEDSISMHGFSTYVDPINGDDTGHHARVEIADVHAELRNDEPAYQATNNRSAPQGRTRAGTVFREPNEIQQEDQAAPTAPPAEDLIEEILVDGSGIEQPMDLSGGRSQEGNPFSRDERFLEVQRVLVEWRRVAGEIKENMYAYENWWMNVDTIIDPLLDELEKIITEVRVVAPDSYLQRLVDKDQTDLLELRKYFRGEAKTRLDQLADDQQEQDLRESSSTGYLGERQEGEEVNRDGVETPYSIRLDPNLERNLEGTRAITNINTRTLNAESKANFAADSIKTLNQRIRLLEQNHTCDPQIYVRLSNLEADVKMIRSAMIDRAEIKLLQSASASQWTDIDKIRTESKNLATEVGALRSRIERCSKVGSNTIPTAPDWGSDIAPSNEASPTQAARIIQSSTRVGQQVRFSNPSPQHRGLPQLDGQPDSIASQSPKEKTITQQESESGRSDPTPRQSTSAQPTVSHLQVGLLNSCMSASAHTASVRRQHQSGGTTMPADDRINLDARQPVPIGWTGRLSKTPLYSADQIRDALHVRNRQVERSDQDITEEPEIGVVLDEKAGRAARALNNHRIHVISMIKTYALEGLDSHERVKDVYNTCMVFMQNEVKELRIRMDTYQDITSQAAQDGVLLDATEQTINKANAWLRGIQSRYTAMGCGLKKLPAKYTEDVPIFDGASDLSVHEFIKRFKACFQGEGSNKEKAELLHRKYLGVEIRRMTEDLKDDWEGLIAELMSRFGHPQTIVTNILKAVPSVSLPTAADNDRANLASHLRQLESAFTQITNLPAQGVDEGSLVSYLTGYQCLQLIRERIPEHMLLELNRVLRLKDIDRNHIVGWDHYKATREFIAEAALDYDTFQPTGSRKSKSKDTISKKKREASSERVNIIQESASQEQVAEATVNISQEADQGRQDTKFSRRTMRLTDAGGYLKCDLDGYEHRKHCLVECEEFWNYAARMKRSLLRNKACFACFGPRDRCISGCTRNPPSEMLCQECTAEKTKFVPAVVLCGVHDHRSKADVNTVLGAMQKFLGRFNGQHYSPAKILDLPASPQ